MFAAGPSIPLSFSLWAPSPVGTGLGGWSVLPSVAIPNCPVPPCRNRVALRLACIGDEMDLCLRRSPRLAQLPGIAMHR